ncbi:hypothetical protein ACF0H5_011608 [Mactra antiquata]
MLRTKQTKFFVAIVVCVGVCSIFNQHWWMRWLEPLGLTKQQYNIAGQITSKTFLTRNDVKHIIVDNEKDCKNRRFLVFQCSSSCGGWGDRQKGSVSAFLLSLMTSRSFIINITTPCDVENILKPAMYNWTMCKRYVQETLNKDPTRNLPLGWTNGHVIYRDRIKEYESLWNTQIVTINLNFYILDEIREFRLAENRLQWVFDTIDSEVIRMILQALYAPRLRLSSELNNYIHKMTKNGQMLVCNHIRTGRNPTIPHDTEQRFYDLSTIFNFLEQYHDVSKYVIYVASDSDSVRDAAAKRFKNFANLNRKIIHVDRFDEVETPNDLCEGFYTALFEQYILSRCDVLVLTRSNFGCLAAYLRGKSEGLFIYDKDKDLIIPSNLTNVQTVYNFD